MAKCPLSWGGSALPTRQKAAGGIMDELSQVLGCSEAMQRAVTVTGMLLLLHKYCPTCPSSALCCLLCKKKWGKVGENCGKTGCFLSHQHGMNTRCECSSLQMSKNHRAGCSQLPVQCITAGLASPQCQLEMGHRTSPSASGTGSEMQRDVGKQQPRLHLPITSARQRLGKAAWLNPSPAGIYRAAPWGGHGKHRQLIGRAKLVILSFKNSLTVCLFICRFTHLSLCACSRGRRKMPQNCAVPPAESRRACEDGGEGLTFLIRQRSARPEGHGELVRRAAPAASRDQLTQTSPRILPHLAPCWAPLPPPSSPFRRFLLMWNPNIPCYFQP
ncbi:uncharacterized protein LOC110390726 [Numida meleagris]|uniref:uncharacterized protein LOC110390726 n=1 Tax=Numida meleagris TaxID=8996 RepID=UPI000B3D955C|nr:uncharacterized protein LOC110390726 [Numida meleagris]